MAGSGRVGLVSDAEHTAGMTSPATAPGAERTRELWSAGDYQRVGVRLVPASEQLVADLQVRPGERLLDIGGGTRNTPPAAARPGGHVICTHIVPPMAGYAPPPGPMGR